MAWCQPDDKSLSKPMMSKVTDAYVHHSVSMSWYQYDQMLAIYLGLFLLTWFIFNTSMDNKLHPLYNDWNYLFAYNYLTRIKVKPY